MYIKFIAVVAFFLMCAMSVSAGEIGFDEKFSLAKDRANPLKQLIPGTEDFYFYHCLHYQNIGEFQKVEEVLQQWIKRYSYTGRVKEIQNRQALLTYTMTPEKSLEYIRNELGLSFHHQKKQLFEKPNYPTQLDQNDVSFETLRGKAVREYSDLSGFEDCALDSLQNLDPDRRRNLLQRLSRPDYKNLARMLVDDLRYRYNDEFGSLSIHNNLTLEQMDECLQLMPELRDQSNFILAYLLKLHPNADIDWKNDPEEKQAFLGRLWGFAQTLPMVHNSLKAHILYHILDQARVKGKYEKKRLLEYLQLPKNASYTNHDYINLKDNRHYLANLHEGFQGKTLFGPVGNDEPLVREFLQHILLDETDTNDFARYVESNYLKKLFAETKILAGIGDMEQWFSLLDPGYLKSLKERVDIDFLPTNPEIVKTSDFISLKVALKNVSQLIVKTYKINTFNYYQTKKEQISTALDLDGLVANDEKVFKYDLPEIRRHDEKFDFPQLTEPGIYVIELIGNGKSSRAIIRKGSLAFTVRTGAGGHVFTVYDENNQKVSDARIWIAGHEYLPDESGEFAVPYTNRPILESIITTRGDFAVLGSFHHETEVYSLSAGFHLDRESVIENQVATLTLRTQLLLNGRQIDMKYFLEPVLTIRSIDRDGVSSSKEIREIKFLNDRETSFSFKIPEKLTDFSFSISGKVESLSQGKKIDLNQSSSLTINGIHKTDHIQEVFLLKDKDKNFLELVGKSGERLSDRPVNLEMKHRMFTRIIQTWLKTDDNGRITLGKLEDIVWLKAQTPENISKTFYFYPDQYSYSEVLHGLEGLPIYIPNMWEDGAGDVQKEISILERRQGTYVHDVTSKVKLTGGFFVVDNLPPGDYEVFLKRPRRTITLRITRGREEDAYLVSSSRFLEKGVNRPLQLTKIDDDQQNAEIVVSIANFSPHTRVHVVGTRYLPPITLIANLGIPQTPQLRMLSLAQQLSKFVSGRNIGDEYRYILERKFARIFPGNMLKRPSLLLNPWSIRKTDTSVDSGSAGEGWSGAADAPAPYAPREEGPGGFGGAVAEGSDFSTYDFLKECPFVKVNLTPDVNGKVKIAKKLLKGQNQLFVMAIDAKNAAYRQFNLALGAAGPRDIRMNRGLNSEGHFSEQKKITAIQKEKDFTIDDISTAKMEVYDSLGAVYGLFSTLKPDPVLTEFAFILQWQEMSEEKKKELYSKYACHELSFFLYKKDRNFFDKVIKPYLANKKDKTFMDKWLLDSDLTDYLTPWKYGRLNIVERILLARKIKGEWQGTRRHVKDLFDLIPPNIEKFNQLFDTALKSSSLETGDRFDFAKQQNAALAASVNRMATMPSAAPPPPPPSLSMRFAAGKDMEKREMARPMKKGKMRLMDSLEASEKDGDMQMEGLLSESKADFDDYGADERRRSVSRQFFRKLDKTEEWVENNYYHIPIEQQIAALVQVNGFWKDFAAAEDGKPFISTNVPEAANSFAEMMLALAVLDLPFKAGEHKTTYQETAMKLRPSYDVVIFHKEIRSTEVATGAQSLLTSQNFFIKNDRYRYENNEKFDKFVTEEFQTHLVYGCQVVVTNPTSARKKVDVLVQIPSGAIPTGNGFFTRSTHMQLEAFSTKTLEFSFYFPFPGDFDHYPVHVSENEKVIAFTKPFIFHVVDQLTKIDTTSWDYISQHGSDREVMKYLDENNIDRLDLDLIAFRMRDKAMFLKVLDVLSKRHVYNNTLWSYGIYHKNISTIREYLQYSSYADRCGSNIQSEPLTVDPVSRFTYQHKEYWPLVNARVYQLGKTRKILNDQFFQQHMRLMEDLRYRFPLGDNDKMAVAYYLLLQDRVEEAKSFFLQVKDETLLKLQYDYMKCFFLFLDEKPAEALEIAKGYENYPVDKWRKIFQDVIAQGTEIQTGVSQVTDQEDRTQTQTKLAETAPHFDFKVEKRQIVLDYNNVNKIRINYYPMDIELLFSRNPFVQEISGQFSVIHPNESVELGLLPANTQLVVDLPKKFHDQNVMIEIVGSGVTRSQAYYPHSLRVQLMETYGQVRVSHEKTGAPISKVYVKVYGKMKSGQVEFFKDGYTDLRGRFDYTSLSTNQLDQVEKFSILVMSEGNGAVVREANPPKM